MSVFLLVLAKEIPGPRLLVTVLLSSSEDEYNIFFVAKIFKGISSSFNAYLTIIGEKG